MARKITPPPLAAQHPAPAKVAQVPATSPAAPDRLQSEITDYIRQKLRTRDGKFLIEESLGAEALAELARTRDYEDLKRITDGIYDSVYWLHQGGFHSCVNTLLEPATLAKLYAALPYKSGQLASGLCELCERGEEFAAVVEYFFRAVMDNLGSRILWKPMVDELMERDGVSATMFFMGEEFPLYLKKWDERVALLDEAVSRWGLRQYIKFMSGGRAAELEEGESFCTNSAGTIFAPAYVNTHPTREENFNSLKIGVVHECGHHKWSSFRVNLHPDALCLGVVGARLAGEKMAAGGRKAFIVEKGDKRIDVREYGDLLKIVKYPKLLAFLHNVADDKRVDTLNMLDNEALADDYAADIALLLKKRALIKGEGLADRLEALLQQTVAGTVNGEIPAGLRAKLQASMGDLAGMELHEATDGTDSLNVALRWYVAIEPEMDELASRVVETGGNPEEELDKALPKGFSGSQTSLENGSTSLENRKPDKGKSGKIHVNTSGKGRKGPRKLGVDPLAFLNLRGNKEGDGKGSGEEPGKGNAGGAGTDEGKFGTGTEPQGGGNPEPGSGNQEPRGRSFRYNSWTGTGYRKQAQHVVEHQSEGRLVRAPKHLADKVKRAFREYAPKEGEFVRGLDSGEPDAEMQERYYEEIDAGHFPEPDYHADVAYERSNVVMSVNIDMSPSMDLDAGGRKKLEVAYEGAAVLACAASILRYPLEASGFAGAEKVEYFLLPADKSGIIVPLNREGEGTPMAGAVRHCTYRTLQLKARSRRRFAYQFWLCDAQPNCSGEGVDALADTARAIEEARARGIRQFGIITADAEEKQKMEDAYRKIFGGGWYVVVTSAEGMIGPLLKFMRRIAMANR